MLTFQNIFKSSFLSNVNAVTAFDMIVALVFALGMGLYIFWVYKKSYRGVMYDSGFGKALAAMTMITTILILAVSSNVVLSLGMVGALSIVRFRTAIKDPMDIIFLFWSIETGIVLAAGMLPLAIIANVLLGLFLLLLSLEQNPNNPYLLVVQCGEERSIQNVLATLGADKNPRMLKSITRRTDMGYPYDTLSADFVEIVIEWHQEKDENSLHDVMTSVKGIDDVRSVSAVSYDGKYVG